MLKKEEGSKNKVLSKKCKVKCYSIQTWYEWVLVMCSPGAMQQAKKGTLKDTQCQLKQATKSNCRITEMISLHCCG